MYQRESQRREKLSYRIADELRRGLVLHLPISEGVGTSVKDTSQYANNGTLVAGPAWVDGREGGKALSFDGTNYVTVPHSASLNITDEVTVEAWFNPTVETDGGPYYHIIVTKSPAYTTGYCLIYDQQRDPNQIRFGTHMDSNYVLYQIPEFNRLYHLVGTIDANLIKLSVDGNLIGQADSVGIPGNANPLRIMGGVVGRYTKGTVDSVRVYNRVLDAIERRNLYNLRGLI